jgi:hypothetical protein
MCTQQGRKVWRLENSPLRIFRNFYSVQNRVKVIKPKEDVIGREYDTDARNEYCIQNLIGKPERKRPRKTEAYIGGEC